MTLRAGEAVGSQQADREPTWQRSATGLGREWCAGFLGNGGNRGQRRVDGGGMSRYGLTVMWLASGAMLRTGLVCAGRTEKNGVIGVRGTGKSCSLWSFTS